MTKENAQPQTTASSKTCSKCGETKSTTEFYKGKGTKDGLRPECKPCKRALARKHHAGNPEKHRERSRKWYEANPEYAREQSRRWREANPDKYHAQNQERLAKRSRRVARIRKMMAHFDGRTGWLENLAAAIAMRSDAQGLSWIASDIDELLMTHYYKDEI